MSDEKKPVDRFIFPARATYQVTAGYTMSHALRSLQQGKFIGQRSPESGRVYMPPLGSCPLAAMPTTEDVELSGKGTVISFCVVHIPVHGQGVKLPFACGDIVLDGADTQFLALIQECDYSEVRIGMRVEVVWKPEEERTTSLASIKYFRPIDEPDRTPDEVRAIREKDWRDWKNA